MCNPPILKLSSEQEYLDHYNKSYCQKQIFIHDGIRVYFKRTSFKHAFYESHARDGVKDIFSNKRAERMNWISETLTNSASVSYQGWNSKIKKYDSKRRVFNLFEEFVVIIQLKIKKDKTLAAEFITCFLAENSIDLIRNSPQWTKQDYLKGIKK